MVQLGSQFVLYYTSLSQVGSSAGKHCIGRAVSTSPEGPFVDDETQPFICDVARGGSVDPSPIVANGRVYLTYQSFGVASHRRTDPALDAAVERRWPLHRLGRRPRTS